VIRRCSARDAEDATDVVAPFVELLQGDPAPNGRPADVVGDEPQQDASCHRALLGAQAPVGRLRQAGDRASHAAGPLVARQAQLPSLAFLPQLHQGGRQQGQRSRLALAVGEQPLDESGLEPEAGAPRGQLDRLAQLVARHRAHEDVVGGQEGRELGIRATAP
jgi:hypothetical protein